VVSNSLKKLIIKGISLFSLVRGVNLFVLVLAQFVSAFFLFAPQYNGISILFDFNFWMIVVATSLSVASGYILNAFFDEEKDLINRPQKTLLERNVSAQTKLVVYFVLIFFALVSASYVSFRAIIFFAVYIGAIALYSVFIKRFLFVGNLTSALLTILPFFAVTVYFRNFNFEIFTHAAYLFLLISMRELIKDLQNLKGDFSHRYQTIPGVFGERITKQFFTFLVLCAYGVVFLLYQFFPLQSMALYFIFALISLSVCTSILWFTHSQKTLSFIHLGIKLIILIGILSLPLLRISL
jgi:4-hydroxybenzoate polyprenyltransferase